MAIVSSAGLPKTFPPSQRSRKNSSLSLLREPCGRPLGLPDWPGFQGINPRCLCFRTVESLSAASSFDIVKRQLGQSYSLLLGRARARRCSIGTTFGDRNQRLGFRHRTHPSQCLPGYETSKRDREGNGRQCVIEAREVRHFWRGKGVLFDGILKPSWKTKSA